MDGCQYLEEAPDLSADAAAEAPATAPRPDSQAARAMLLWFAGRSPAAIAEEVGVSVATVQAWRKRFRWAEVSTLERVEVVAAARLVELIARDKKSGGDFKEIDLLTRQIERVARIKQFGESGKASDLNPAFKARAVKGGKASAAKAAATRNAFAPEQVEAVESAFLDDLFGYQKQWNAAVESHRILNILKSRQIGATRFFGRWALKDALITGKNKIFLSASKAQAHVFRSYILELARNAADVELKGDPIRLGNGAELYFLGTNTKTAQSYHGDVLMDEYFWIQRFAEFRKVASGMAMHRQWKQIYTSTPSSVNHEAYPFWTGEAFNKKRKKSDRVEFSVDHSELKNGAVCPDGQWRQIITVEDAIAGGCNLFDLEQLRNEYGPEEFNNLLMCEFVDDALSAFPFSLVQGCLVDSWEVWTDYRPFASRPMGDAPVWIGYDPSGDSENSDGAGLAIVAPPAIRGKGRHRVLERERLRGKDYEKQAAAVLDLLARYNVEHIGIDVTGIGDAVAKIVAVKFPRVTRYQYNAALKANMVLQSQQMMRSGRLEFDAGWSDVVQSFLAIHREATAGGRAVTFTGGRNEQTGHADLAWAIMHALHHEPIEAPAGGGGVTLEFS